MNFVIPWTLVELLSCRIARNKRLNLKEWREREEQ
jgi:hypothetical protein